MHGGVLLQVHPHRDSAWRPLWSADGTRLVSCSSDGSVVVFSGPVGKE
ncbi:MAG: WD40 repeat domain-containing protein [Planctomycetota bacterium]|nr:WD40 repeat domain-containing protein [Planctomycetota bacterium]